MKLARRTALTLAAVALVPAARAQWTTEAVLNEMAPFIQPCVQPTAGPRVFTRCFDTHSSVHAHWAPYRIARNVPPHEPLAIDSEAALEYGKVRREVAAHVTYPYAEAWFLLLAIEYERWATERARPEPLRLRPLGNAVATRLLDRYETTAPVPTSTEYSNAAWHLLQLHRWYEFSGDAARRARVDSLVQGHFLGTITAPTFRRDIVNPTRFFSTHGNWVHLVLETQHPATVAAFVAAQGVYPDDHIVPNPINQLPHSYGLGWSRTWALRSMARNASSPYDRARFWRAAEAHIHLGMQRHLALQGNFPAYDHWVPQFAVYAVTDGD